MNTSKKIISFLILVFAMLTITTISSFAAEDTRIEVSEFIATSDFVAPSYNSKVKTDYKFTFTTGAQAQAYSRMSGWHKWNEESSGWERYSDSRFSTGKYRYFVQIRIDSDSGYGTTHKLAKTATVIVDGAEWEYSDNPTVESKYSYTYIYSPEFDVKKIIKRVEITDLTMPIIGENPDYDISVPSDLGYYVSQYEGKDYVDWYANGIMTEILPVNYKYNSSDEYIFATLIEAEEGCKFSSDVTVMVGDLSASVASNSGDSIIIMLENIKAVEKTYTVTVSNATASKQQAKAGEIITLTANAPSAGKVFDKWLVSGATVANAASKTTTFTMPENDVTATATYKNCIHTFDNACDKDCNICQATRTPADHTGGTATCTEKAVCAECRVKYGELAAHTVSAVKGKAATCTANGTIDHYKCDACGALCSDSDGLTVITDTTVKATGHSIKKVASVSATCTKNGNVEHYKCSKCSKLFSDSEGKKAVSDVSVKAKGHSYSNACDTSCNTCKATRKITHSYKSVTTKATLTKNGKVESKCSVCDYVSKTTTVYYPKTIKLSKTSYTYDKKVKTPTVTVKDSKGNTLKKDTDYTVSYESGRKTPGKYTVKITFKGKYEGTKRLYFSIAPKATSKITATQTTTTITLKWTAVTGADSYRVYKYNSKTKKYEKLKDVTKNTLKISKLKEGTAYKYKVRAITKDDGSIYGAYSDVFETATKCKTPSIKKLTTTKGKASFTWSDVSGESGYQVYYSTKKDSGFKKAASYKTNVVKGSKTKLKSGKKYYFKVRAYKKTASGTVYSSWSAVKSVKIK